MSFFTQFSSSGPAKITTYTSGSGNFSPISTNQSWARITIVGGGGGGAGGGSNSAGGKSGASLTWWQKLNLSSYSYSVGAGGTSGANSAGNAGGNTRFGSITVLGAGSTNQTWLAVAGAGYMQNNPSTVNYANNLFPQNQPLGGITQASGGPAGGQPGYEVTTLGGGGSSGQGNYPGAGGASSMYGQAGNGGFSFTGGDGNQPTAGNAGTGFGAGGGGGAKDNNNATVNSSGGAGSAGVIIIEEFIQ